jgi:hypothetical protein
MHLYFCLLFGGFSWIFWYVQSYYRDLLKEDYKRKYYTTIAVLDILSVFCFIIALIFLFHAIS